MSDGKLDMSKIDENIRNAQARQSLQDGTSDSEGKHGRKKLSDEEKAARDAQREAEKAAKKAEREAARAAKKAEREANKQPAHLKKVEKALDRLPELSEGTQDLFSRITVGFSISEVEALAAHLEGFVRLERTKSALSRDLRVGQTVRIVGGDPRFVGKTGTVERSQRIRCYVTVPGVTKSVYLFTSDVVAVEGGNEVEAEQDSTAQTA